MAKRKPHKGLLKRIKVTGGGKVVRRKAFSGHLMSGKSGRRRQRLRQAVVVTGALARKLKEAVAAN